VKWEMTMNHIDITAVEEYELAKYTPEQLNINSHEMDHSHWVFAAIDCQLPVHVDNLELHYQNLLQYATRWGYVRRGKYYIYVACPRLSYYFANEEGKVYNHIYNIENVIPHVNGCVYEEGTDDVVYVDKEDFFRLSVVSSGDNREVLVERLEVISRESVKNNAECCVVCEFVARFNPFLGGVVEMPDKVLQGFNKFLEKHNVKVLYHS